MIGAFVWWWGEGRLFSLPFAFRAFFLVRLHHRTETISSLSLELISLSLELISLSLELISLSLQKFGLTESRRHHHVDVSLWR
jgi:hypothetical protein